MEPLFGAILPSRLGTVAARDVDQVIRAANLLVLDGPRVDVASGPVESPVAAALQVGG